MINGKIIKKIIVCFVILLSGCSEKGYVYKALDALEPNNEACVVLRVLEGNQFYCRTPDQDVVKVMLLGIKIEEGLEEPAKEFLKNTLPPLRTYVWIDIDNYIKGPGGNRLSFVFLEDKTFLNGYMIREGYAYKYFEGSEKEFQAKFNRIYDSETIIGAEDPSYEQKTEESDTGRDKKKQPWLR